MSTENSVVTILNVDEEIQEMHLCRNDFQSQFLDQGGSVIVKGLSRFLPFILIGPPWNPRITINCAFCPFCGQKL